MLCSTEKDCDSMGCAVLLEGVDGMGDEGEGVVMIQMWRLGMVSASEDGDDGDDDK